MVNMTYPLLTLVFLDDNLIVLPQPYELGCTEKAAGVSFVSAGGLRPLPLNDQDVVFFLLVCFFIISATVYDYVGVGLLLRKIRAKQKWHQTEGRSLMHCARGELGRLAQYGRADGRAVQRQNQAQCQRNVSYVLTTCTHIHVYTPTHTHKDTKSLKQG